MTERRRAKILDIVLLVMGCTMAFYHLFCTQYLFQGYYHLQINHLAFAIILVFLGTLKTLKKRRFSPLIIALLLISFLVTIYMKVFYNELELRMGSPNTMDVVIGVLLIIMVLESTRQAFGTVLPIVALLFIVYFFFGHLIPGPFYHTYFPPEKVISWLGIGFSGIFGSILNVSANQIFLFVVFGTLISTLGAYKFIFELGKSLGRMTVGGAGQTAVVASATIGMFTGSALADVALVGGFTIPYMKDTGYKPNLAGAIAATAATGAQIMPPVMSATVFLLATFIGVPYAVVMIAAIIPALLYYFAVFIGVEVVARRENIKPMKVHVDYGILRRFFPIFIIPLGVIISLLLLGYTPMYTSFYAIVSIVVVSYFIKETRPSLHDLISGFAKGALTGAKLAVAVALVGMIAQVLITTGLGIKLGGVVENLARGNIFMALFLTMIVSLILGCGMPTIAAYSIIAMIVVPVLVRMGTPIMAAHLFAFYFGTISTLTPPVALAALTAAAIAGGGFFRTSFLAVKLAFSGFMIPFLFVYNPAVLGHFSDPLATIVATFIAVLSTFIAIIIALYGYSFGKVTLWERVLFTLSASGLFVYSITIDYLFFGIGMLLFVPLALYQWRRRQLGKVAVASLGKD